MVPKPTYQIQPLGHEEETDEPLRVELGALDFPAARKYTDMILVFKTEPEALVDDLISRLKSSLAQALCQFRILAGRLCIDDDNSAPWASVHKSDSVPFTVHLLDRSFPSYQGLEEAHFAQDLFTPNLLLPEASRGAVAAMPRPGDLSGVPICQFQANIIRGGLLLVMTWHDTVADATGVDTFLSQWAANGCVSPRMNGERNGVVYDLFNSLNRSALRSKAIPYRGRMEDLTARLASQHFTVARARGHDEGDNTKNLPLTSLILRFPQTKCQLLKSTASQKGEVRAMATKDAVLALLFRAVFRARLLASPHANLPAKSAMTIAVDARRFLRTPLPDDYVGNVAYFTRTKPVAARDLLATDGLSDIAARIQDAQGQANSDSVRELVEWIGGIKNKNRVVFDGASDRGLGVRFSDWASIKVYERDFGFGCPKAVRYGKPTSNGEIALYPRRLESRKENEGIEVAVSLDAATMGHLSMDEELRQFAILRE